MKRVGDLNYDFKYGACGTFNFPDQRILLCFSQAKKTRCERFFIFKGIFWVLITSLFSYDGDFFHNQADSKTEHAFTTLAKIDEAPLAVGGQSSNTNKAEILDISSNKWTEIAEYPYHD